MFAERLDDFHEEWFARKLKALLHLVLFDKC
jgi:hypothetical protein